MLTYRTAQGRTQHRGRSRPGRKLSTPIRGPPVRRPIGHELCVGRQSHPPLPPLLAASLPTQSLILNSVGCVVTEAPEDLNSAFRMVSGSTSAGGLDEVAGFPLRGSSLSFFTDGLSLSRLWRAEKTQSPCQCPLTQDGTHYSLCI